MAEVFDEHFDVSEEDVRERMFVTIDTLWPDPNNRPDLREGQLIWSMTAPTVKEIVEFYSDLNEMLNLSFLQYTRGEFLDAKGLEIGIPRIEATQSEGLIRFLGEGGTIIPTGTTVTTTAEDEGDEVYQFDTNSLLEDGVTPVPIEDRTISAVADPVETDATQRISLEPIPTMGSFLLEFNGDVTTPINYNDTALDVKNALEALPSVGAGNVEVADGPFPFADVLVTFQNDLGSAAQPLMTLDSVIGGYDGGVVITSEVTGTNAKATFAQYPAPDLPDVPGPGWTGSAIWKYTWVTVLGDEREDNYEAGFGETAASPQSDVATLSNEYAVVTLEQVPSYSNLNEITKVRLYRSFNDGSGFSDFKLVGEADVPVVPGPIDIIDDITNIDFEVIQETLEDSNTTGVVDIPSTSVDTGAATNVSPHAIALLDDVVLGVERVTNPQSFSGGDDEETDDAYRARLLEEIQKPPGAGNVSDYEGWAKSIAGVGGVTVVPEWEEEFGYPNGPGTVKVILSGSNNETVNSDLIEEVRQYIAGDVALASPLDLYGTTPSAYGISSVVTPAAGDIDAGTYEYAFTFVNVGGGETPHSAAQDDGTEDGSMLVTVVVGTTGSKVELIDIPTGPTGIAVSNTVKRRIYRRNTGSTDDHLFLVGEILDNTTTTFEDTVADGDIGLRFAPVVNSTSQFNGVAPIGAHVTVESISEFSVKVNATIIPASGYNLLGTGGNINLGNAIRLNLKTFFQNLPAGSVVYFKDVENVIHDTAGVLDFRDVELETSAGTTVSNLTPPTPTAKPVFDSTGVLTEAVA